MGIDLVGLLIGGATLGWSWLALRSWRGFRQRRLAEGGLRELEDAMDADAVVAFTVATHELKSRGHTELWSLHLLYGLLQDEQVQTLLKKVGADPDAIESRVLTELEQRKSDPQGARDAITVINRSYATAHVAERKISVTDLTANLLRTEVPGLVGVDRYELLFLLVHGMTPPELDTAGRTDVHVVLRNDDFTTHEFVTEVLCEVFGLSQAEAQARTMETHTNGKAVVGRYKLPVAKERLAATRSRARNAAFPLWIGVEDC